VNTKYNSPQIDKQRETMMNPRPQPTATADLPPWKEKRRLYSLTMSKPLSQTYPVNSVVELTLKGDEKVKGVVYCTDEMSQTVVLKKALTHTTLASEIFMVQADTVTKKEIIEEEVGEEEKVPVGNVSKKTLEQQEKKAIRLAEEALQHINQKVRQCSTQTTSCTCTLLVAILFHVITLYFQLRLLTIHLSI
jgi:hypothetical protein